MLFPVVPQDFQDQALPRQEAEAEQAHSSVDQNEDWQQDQVCLECLDLMYCALLKDEADVYIKHVVYTCGVG